MNSTKLCTDIQFFNLLLGYCIAATPDQHECLYLTSSHSCISKLKLRHWTMQEMLWCGHLLKPVGLY